jgi:hypothetical protein
MDEQLRVDQIVWTLCGEIEQIITIEPPVRFDTALAMSKFIKYTYPEFYFNCKRVG